MKKGKKRLNWYNVENDMELLKVQKRFALKLLLKEIGLILLCIFMTLILVPGIFFYIWYNFTESDVLYLIVYYALFGSIINMSIIICIEDAIKNTWHNNCKIFNRRTRLSENRIKRIEWNKKFNFDLINL